MACFPPNDLDICPDYDTDYIPVLAALWGASGGAEWGRQLADDWAISGEWAGENDPDEVDRRWNSFKSSGTALGVGYLEDRGREFLETWSKKGRAPAGEVKARRDRLAVLNIERLSQLHGTADEALARIGVAPDGNTPETPVPGAAGWGRPRKLPDAVASAADLLNRLVWVSSEAAYVDRKTGVTIRRPSRG